jgi:hypothetical protein
MENDNLPTFVPPALQYKAERVIRKLAQEREATQIDFEQIYFAGHKTNKIAFKIRFPTKFHAESMYNALDNSEINLREYGHEAIYVDGSFCFSEEH